MKKLAGFLIERRYYILAFMLAAMVACGILAVNVPINRDRTKYLADDSGMKQGLSIMESQFSDASDASSIRVMFDDLDARQIEDVKGRLEAIPNVSSVTYEADSETYNRDNHTLFVVNTDFDYTSDEEKNIEKAIETGFSEYAMEYQNNDLASTVVPLWLILVALALAVTILLIMSDSWLDPLLFLATIGIAVVINSGTNAILPYTDEMTATIGPVLQLVLSMDYSIILMSRYRQEKRRTASKTEAMKTALAGSFSSVASSSLTTAVGLLALVFLSFKLGPELGIVLAKGVLISMLCVFTVLPAMILAFDRGLEKTRKKALHIPAGGLSKISYKLRFFMPVIFVVLLVGSFFLQSLTKITFTESSEDSLAHIFPKENTVVLLYDNRDEKQIGSLVSELEKDKRVSSVLGVSNTLGKKMDAKEMSDAIGELGSDMQIDENFVRMLYFLADDEKLPSLTVSEFLHYITDTVLPDKNLNAYLDDEIRTNVDRFKQFSDKEKLTAPMTAGEMAEFFGIGKEEVKKLFLYYTIKNGVADSGKMTVQAFTDFVLNTVAKDELYGAMLDPEKRASLEQLKNLADPAYVQAERSASGLAKMLGMDRKLVKILFVLQNARDVSKRKMTVSEFASFLCDHMMTNEMFRSGFDEATKAQLQSMRDLIRIAESKKGLSAGEMAQVLGVKNEQAEGLYYLYFANDPAFQQETAAMKMTFGDFLSLLKANAAGDRLKELVQLEQFIGLASSGQQLDAASMAGILGMDENMAALLFRMNGVQTMTLTDFLAAALQLAPDNEELQKNNQLIRLALSGELMDAETLAAVFGMETAQVYQLFGVLLSAQKTISLFDFTNFLVTSVLTDKAYAGNFSKEQAVQIQQMNGIVRLAASGKPLQDVELAKVFGMDAGKLRIMFRLRYGADIKGKTMSLQEFVAFLLSDPDVGGMLDPDALAKLHLLQSVMGASVTETAFTSGQLAELLGMDRAQTEQLYILYMDKNGASWTLSPQTFVSFAMTDVLGDPELSGSVDEASAADLRRGHTLIEAVVSGKSYSAEGMSRLLASLSDEVTKNDIEVLYLYYGGMKDLRADRKMSILDMVTFLSEDLLNDERFTSYFNEEMRADILNSKEDLKDALAKLKGERYSRLIITSDYPDESEETHAFTKRLQDLCGAHLRDYHLVGNSIMVSEMNDSFGREYLMITLITAIAIFLVVLFAFRNPILPLILTLIVQCGVFITVTVIGAYSGAMYYLALLIVQSILMGATIDYGIVFCNFYRENRKTESVTQSLKAAYEGSLHTIMTSGSILVLVLAALGLFASSAMISEVCITMSIGVFIAILLILFVLPGLVVCCDRLIVRGKTREKRKQRKKRHFSVHIGREIWYSKKG